MNSDLSESGNTYVANINVTITAPNRYQILLDDPSPDCFLIETGASGDGRFAISLEPGTPCPYGAIEFVFTVGADYAFVSRGFMDGAKVKNSGWSFGPVRMAGSQCSVTAQIPAGKGTFDDYVLFCQAVSRQTPTILTVGPKARRGDPVTGHDEGHITGHDEGHITGHDEGHITGHDEGHITGHDEGLLTGDKDVLLTGDRDILLTGDEDVHLTGERDVHLTGDKDVFLTGDEDVLLTGD